MSKKYIKSSKKITASLVALILSITFFTLSITGIIVAQKDACAYTRSYQESYEKYINTIADSIAIRYANMITDLSFPDMVTQANEEFEDSKIGIQFTRSNTRYCTENFTSGDYDGYDVIYSGQFWYIYRTENNSRNTPILCSPVEYNLNPDKAYYVEIDISSPTVVTKEDKYYNNFALFNFLYEFKYIFILIALVSFLCMVGIIIYIAKLNVNNPQPVNKFERIINKPISTIIYLGSTAIVSLLILLLLRLTDNILVFRFNGSHFINYVGIIITTIMLATVTAMFFYELIRRIIQHTFINRLVIVHIYNKANVLGKGIIIGIITFLLLVLAFILNVIIHPTIMIPFILAITALWIIFIYKLSKLSKIIDSYAEGDWDDCLTGNPLIISDIYRNMNKISTSMQAAVAKSIRNERTKTELITNVSHDIKTPLTSIINYTDLLKRKDITEEERTKYLETLSRNSARMKKLIEDLIEASKASTGNIELNMMNCNLKTLISQSIVEHSDNAVLNNLKIVCADIKDDLLIYVDGTKLYRVFDNILSNACKYSLSGSRIYVSAFLDANTEYINIIFKNISEQEITISPDELTERFVRGDMSRHSEGSGLGLAISKSLTELMRGTLKIDIDGDQFKVTLRFPKATVL